MYGLLNRGDVYESWKVVLRVTHLGHEDQETASSFREKLIQVSLITWLLLSSFRMGFSALLDIKWIGHHVFGNTMFSVGDVGKLACICCGLIILQCTMFVAYFHHLNKGKKMVFLHHLKQQTRTFNWEQRQHKIKLARRILKMSLVAFSVILIGSVIDVTAMLFVNWQVSQTSFEKFMWTFWWIQDVPLLVACEAAFVFPPSVWLYLVMSLRMDMKRLIREIRKGTRSRMYTVLEIQGRYNRLVRDVVAMTPLFSSVVSVYVICSTPLICTIVYTLHHLDNVLFAVSTLVGGAPMIGMALWFMAMAAQVHSSAEELHFEMCKFAAIKKDGLVTFEKEQLLKMVEELGSENGMLALSTLDGDKFTTRRLFYYLVDTAMWYTLLVSLERFFMK